MRSTFVVVWLAGWSFLLLALFYLLTDVWKWRRWAFQFVVFGTNVIKIYVAYHSIPLCTIAAGLSGGLVTHLGRGGLPLVELATVTFCLFLISTCIGV